MSKSELPFAFADAGESTGFLLWQVTAMWQRQVAATLRQHKITQVQFVLLAGILWLSSKERNITQIMLARHTKADVMTTSQVLRTLEAKKHIKRKPHPTDTRANTIHLTEAGKKLVFAAIPDVERIDGEFFERIRHELKTFNAALRKLTEEAP